VLFLDQSQTILADLKEVAWHSLVARGPSWTAMADYADKVNTMSMEGLAKIQDPARNEYSQAIEMFKTLSNFIDDRTGECLGEVDKWGPGRALCIDHLTITNYLFLGLVTGGRSIRSIPEWGVAMEQQMMFLRNLCQLQCSVVVLTHIAPEREESTGNILRYPLALGTKNAPQIPALFDEALHSVRRGDEFFWSNVTTGMAVKKRILPFSDKLLPTFVTVFDEWKARGGVLSETLMEDDNVVTLSKTKT
jgi:hypothetical protein